MNTYLQSGFDLSTVRFSDGEKVRLECGGKYYVDNWFIQGQADNVLLSSYGTGRKPEIICNPGPGQRYPLRLVDISHWVVEDIKFSGGTGLSQVYIGHGLTKDMTDIRFRNIEVDGTNLGAAAHRCCIRFATEDYTDSVSISDVEVSGSDLYNAGKGNNYENADAIQIHGVKAAARIIDNDLHDNNGEGIDCAGGFGHTIILNRSTGNGGAGMKLHSQQYAFDAGFVYGNRCENNGSTRQFQAQLVNITNTRFLSNLWWGESGVGCLRMEDNAKLINGIGQRMPYVPFSGNEFVDQILASNSQSQGCIDFHGKRPSEFMDANRFQRMIYVPLSISKILSDAIDGKEDCDIAEFSKRWPDESVLDERIGRMIMSVNASGPPGIQK